MSNHEQPVGFGLTRYRSAPSSYFASFLNPPNGEDEFGTEEFEQLFNPRASSPETQRIFSRFMNSSQQNTPPTFVGPTKTEAEQPQLSSEIVYQTQPVDNSKRLFCPPDPHSKIQGVGVANSALIRHSSSPAGLFANIDIENGRFKSEMTSVSELESKGITENVGDKGFSLNSWDDDFLKGLTDDDSKVFSDVHALDDQRNEGGNWHTTSLLSHHLSLPKSATEKLMQDSVPCKVRAKRGCATHPRSIAERVRRTKISERMRKLQELVPNMEKQTNTSDMLDLAVEYIKDLQSQVKTLSDNRDKCSCSAKQR